MNIKKIIFPALILGIVLVYLPILLQNMNSSENLITTNVSEMIPSTLDNPKIEKINDSHIKVSYMFYFGYDVMELKSDINKLSSIADAQENYNSIKQQYSGSNQINVNLGDDSFGIEKKQESSIVVFRKGNVVVNTELDGMHTSLDQTINYAKKIKV